ncbi:TPA: Fur family transcriptional regulator [Neisseria bacilliformis]|uniref:Fur family transcriptional regulator n=1 Tax=Neisseria bacilliformis TaxID=267212 RepID=UPI000668218B|nr:Fur family transcriptional regulator [Neisseria bacilliformis]
MKQKIIDQTRANGAQVTALREHVLDIVLQQEGVIKAYNVLSLMQQQSATPVAPPTAYRALDFWVEQGVLHKIAAVNGYVLCSHARHNCREHGHEDHAGHSHSAFILVCTKCGAVDEQSLSKQWEELQRALGDTGFEMTEEHLVLTGVCAKCH